MVSDRSEEAAIVKILRYIEENYRSASLTEIADSLHYDLYWLSREIKHRTGKTFMELLQEKRPFAYYVGCSMAEVLYATVYLSNRKSRDSYGLSHKNPG